MEHSRRPDVHTQLFASLHREFVLRVRCTVTSADLFSLGRPVDVIEGQGTYAGPYDFDFAIALDAKNGLIFSFVWNLQDRVAG